MMKKLEFFYSYAHEDIELCVLLDHRLVVLKRDYPISVWFDQMINPGEDRKKAIEEHLNSANLFLLLVSPDFMYADHCRKEMQHALERHVQEKASVVPVHLRPTYLENAPFAHIQMVPTNGFALTSWKNQDEAFLNIITGISKTIHSLRSSQDGNIVTDEDSRFMQISSSYLELDDERANLSDAEENWFEEDRPAYELKRFEEAIYTYDQVIRLNPNDTTAYSNKGWALCELKRFEEAIRLNPYDAVAYNNKGWVLGKLEQFEDAIADFEEAIYLNAYLAAAYRNKGWALYELKRFEQALADYEQATRLDPYDAVAYRGKGNALYNLGRLDEALVAYEQALRLNSKSATTYCGKGDILHNLKRFAKALTAYEEAIRLNPYEAMAYYGKGNVLCSLGRFEEALTAYELALAAYEQAYEQTLAVYEQALRPYINFAYVYHGKGNVLYSLRRFDEARKAHQAARELGYS